LGALVGGELPDTQAGALREHLRGCDACRRQWEALEASAAALQEWPEAEVSAADSLRLAARLRGRLSGRRRLQLGDVVFLVACAAFALLGALVLSPAARAPLLSAEGLWRYALAGGVAIGVVVTAGAVMLLLAHNRGEGGISR